MGAIGVVFGAGVVTQGEVFAATSSLTVNIASSISLDLNPIYPNGTFASSSTSDNTISVKTDNFTGYTLGIAAKTANNNALTYTNNNVVVATIPSIASAVSATNYADNTYATANHLNNTWGFRPSKYNSVDNTVTNNYYPAPTSTETNNIVLDATSVANPTTFNNYNIAIGARVNMDTQPGAYNNTFVITAVANPINYTIAYDKGNTTDEVTNLPANQTGTLDNPDTTADIALTSSTPSRSGYVFTGWCTIMPTTTDGTDSCAGAGSASYATGSTYPLDATTNPNVTLYAMWKNPCPTGNSYIYCKVASQVKTYGGAPQTQDAAALQATITAPAAGSTPATDTSNSGVFLYNSGVFGTSSDVNDGYDIYYYRGILDRSFTSSTYGSSGDSAYYQNYVRLGDTCWRIVRTTASGGTKMIYNGLYSGGTTANSCANAQTDAQVTVQAFGLKGNSVQSSWYYNVNRVGYTFNNTQSLQDSTDATDVNTVFGSDANPGLNNARSNIKTYIEDTWYTNISAYTSILEASAGYCNDRTAYSDESTSTKLTTIKSYATSGATMYFGAYGRNMNYAKTPSLTCPRSTVDLYRYVPNSTGVSNELKYPVALITADEASFAGSGSSTATGGSAYNAKSYLRSGYTFWLLSPRGRASNGYAYEFDLRSNGYLDFSNTSNTHGVRPAISLKPGTTAASGTGIATDPWVVTAPQL